MSDWSGRRVTQARAIVATWLPAPCGRCGLEVDGEDPWVVGHIRSRAAHPELTWVVSNWQPEHRACSDPTGQAAVIEKARAEGARAAIANLDARDVDSDFPDGDEARKSPLLPFSLSTAREAKNQPIDVRDGLSWAPEAMRAHPWLEEFAEVPPDASPPLWMSPVPHDAVGSYGAQAVEWIEAAENKRLRWWQHLAIVRQLEHREDGSLCHREVLESAPRRSGKSVRIRGVALWRMAHAEKIGEVQTIVHCGNDLPICREIQRGAWRWAEDVADWTVTRSNGKEAIEAPDGSRWVVRSQEGVYGWDAGLAAVDEAWDVPPMVVSEGLEPAMLERLWAQLHLTSTAHRRSTSLMRGRLSAALAVDDGETLLLVWGAPPGADISDPEVWRAASAHWSEDRRRMIAAKYEKALAGEVDPEADDPDPMAGFCAQYLNMWRLTGRAVVRGNPLIEPETWGALTALVDDERRPDAAAIESWSSDGVSLALGWRDDDGGATVRVIDHDDLASAAAALKASRFRGRVTVGASLAEDPALRGVQVTATKARTGAAVVELGRLAAEGLLRHDGGEHLTNQVLDVRTQPGAEGPRLVSKGRADAVKAAAWASTGARQRRPTLTGIVTSGR